MRDLHSQTQPLLHHNPALIKSTNHDAIAKTQIKFLSFLFHFNVFYTPHFCSHSLHKLKRLTTLTPILLLRFHKESVPVPKGISDFRLN